MNFYGHTALYDSIILILWKKNLENILGVKRAFYRNQIPPPLNNETTGNKGAKFCINGIINKLEQI